MISCSQSTSYWIGDVARTGPSLILDSHTQYMSNPERCVRVHNVVRPAP